MHFLTVLECAKALRVSPSTVYSLAKERRIAHRRVGVGRGRLLFTEQDIQEYLASCEVRAGSQRTAVTFTHSRNKPASLQ
jgi:excisionase family DNA binding protein